MIAGLKAALAGMHQGALDSARGNERRADHARKEQVEEQREAVQHDFEEGMENITAAKEKAIAAGIGAGVQAACAVVGAVAVGMEAAQGLTKLASGVGGASGGASSAIGEAFAQDNELAAAAAKEAAGYARANGTRYQAQADEAQSDAGDAKQQARDRFRAAIEMVNGIEKTNRVDGGAS